MKNVPHDLQERLKGHEWTKANDSDPRIELLLTKPRSAIVDSDYFIVETIRHRPSLGDIAVAPRRLAIGEQPDRIYECHIEEGKIETAYKNYPDTYEQGWIVGRVIEPASAVAIAFDGEWKRYGERWRIVTEEEPYIFWRNASGNLICQKWHDDTTKLELAQTIEKVKAIRAWKSAAEPMDDNGIIALYSRSDGKLYYRAYATQANGEKVWEAEREIETTFEVAEFNLFLTNDYRTGIIARGTDNHVYYLISKRNWAGMGIEPEYLKCYTDIAIDFIKIGEINTECKEYIKARAAVTHWLSYTGTDNEILSAKNTVNNQGNYGRIVEVKTKNDIRLSGREDWELVDDTGKTYTAITYSTIFGRRHKIGFANFNNVEGNLTVRFKGLHGCNANDIKYGPMSLSFTPTNLVPVVIIPPTLSNEGAYTIRCTFTHDITNPVTLIDALKVTTEGYIDTRKTLTVTDTHEIASVEVEGSNTIKITLSETGRLKRARTATVEFDDSLGSLQNANGEAVESFITSAEVSGFEFVSDIYRAEYIDATTSVSANLIYITKKETTSKEYIEAATAVTIDFIDINNLNP